MITLLQTAAGQPGMMSNLLLIVALIAIFYFFMIRPQQKRQKEINNFRNALSVGQDVVTIGGIHGTIKHIDEVKLTVTLRVANGVEIVFDKTAIVPAGVQPVQQ